MTFGYLSSEINAGFFYKSAEEREKLVGSERKFIDDRVQKVIELKKKVIDLFHNAVKHKETIAANYYGRGLKTM